MNEITNVFAIFLSFCFFRSFIWRDGRTELKGIRGPSRANADYCWSSRVSLSLSVPVRDDIMYVIHYYIVLQAIYDRRHIWTQRRNKKELHIRWWLLQLIPVKHLFIRNDDETRRERERERETLDLHSGFSAAFTVAAVVFYVKLHKRQRPKKYIRPDSTFWSARTRWER